MSYSSWIRTIWLEFTTAGSGSYVVGVSTAPSQVEMFGPEIDEYLGLWGELDPRDAGDNPNQPI